MVKLNLNLNFECTKCSKPLQLVISDMVEYNGFSINDGAVLGQVAIGGGAAHLEEQLSALDIPSIHHTTFTDIERQLGSMFNDEVTKEIMEGGKETINTTMVCPLSLWRLMVGGGKGHTSTLTMPTWV